MVLWGDRGVSVSPARASIAKNEPTPSRSGRSQRESFMRGATIFRVPAIAMEAAFRHSAFMKKVMTGCFLVWLGAAGLALAADPSGEQLAQSVWQASGGENWGKVKSIDFTFAVEKGGKTVMSADHHF